MKNYVTSLQCDITTIKRRKYVGFNCRVLTKDSLMSNVHLGIFRIHNANSETIGDHLNSIVRRFDLNDVKYATIDGGLNLLNACKSKKLIVVHCIYDIFDNIIKKSLGGFSWDINAKVKKITKYFSQSSNTNSILSRYQEIAGKTTNGLVK